MRSQVEKYSLLPWVKKQQKAFNEQLINRAGEILRMGGQELGDAYVQELRTAKEESRRPYKTILDAIERRQTELI